MQIIDFTGRGTRNRVRNGAPRGIVYHTFGSTFVNKQIQIACAAGEPCSTEEEIDDLCAAAFDKNQFQGNYVVGRTGKKVYQIDDDNNRTMHSGLLSDGHPSGVNIYATEAWATWAHPLNGDGWVKHGRDPRVVYDWWYEQCGDVLGIKTPMQLPHGRTPNDYIGIDVRPSHIDGSYTAAQIDTVVELARFLASRHGWPLDLPHNTTHSISSPCERGTVAKPIRDANGKKIGSRIIGIGWDPGGNWNHPAFLKQLKGE